LGSINKGDYIGATADATLANSHKRRAASRQQAVNDRDQFNTSQGSSPPS